MPDTKTISVPVQIKAVGDHGAFEAIVSVFGNTDLDNERVMPTAFDRTILDWRSKGQDIPVLLGHDAGALIGGVNPNEATVTKTDLRVKGQFDLTRRLAQEAYQMAKNGLLTQWSFGYNPKVSKLAADGVGEIHDLDLGEFSMTSRPSNELTATLAVKSDEEPVTKQYADEQLEVKAGRRLSKATETELQSLHDDIGALQGRMRALMGIAEDAAADDTAGKANTEHDSITDATPTSALPSAKAPDADQEPTAKSRTELDIRVEQELAALVSMKEERHAQRRP